MNRTKLNKRLENISDSLRSELEYYLEFSDDFCDCLEEYIDVFGLNKEIKQILIDVGYVFPVDMDKTFSTGKKYWFALNKVYYQVDSSWSQFFNN